MLMNGDIYITNDCDLANRLSIDPKFKVMSLTERPDDLLLPQIKENCLAFLLPTYTSLDAYDRGNMQEFYALYYNHLCSREAATYILLLIVGIYRGYTMILYVPKEDSEMEWISILLNYINENYGLCVGNMVTTKTAFNSAYTNRILYAELDNCYMTVEEVLQEWIGDIDDPMMAISMCKDLHLELIDDDPIKTINAYKNINNNPKPIVPLPFKIVV